MLLHGKKEQHDAKGYKKRLAEEPKDARALRDFEEVAKRPRMRPVPPAVEDSAPEPVGSPAPGTPVGLGEADVPDVEGPCPVPIGEGDDGPAIPGIPAVIDGARCIHDTRGGQDGLRLYCKYHAGSDKYRSRRLDPWGHGPRAAEYYLGAWMAFGAARSRADRKANPKREDVEAYKAAHEG